MSEIFGSLASMTGFLWNWIGPTMPVLAVLAVHINGSAAHALLEWARGRHPEDPAWAVERLSRLGGLAQLAGLLGTVQGLLAMFSIMDKPELVLGALGHAIVSTVVGVILSMIAEGTSTYVLLRRRIG